MLIVLALIISVGGHWAFLQTVAWAGMAVEFSKEESVSTALIKTFNGKNPCKLCKFVSEGKDSEKKTEHQSSLKKLDSFTCSESEFWFPPLKQISIRPIFAHSSIAEPPLTPPPLLS